MSSRESYRCGAAANAALYALGILVGAALVASLGYSAGTIALVACAMATCAALGESAAWRIVPPRVRAAESLARRGRRVCFIAATCAIMTLMAALNDPAGPPAAFGAATPTALRLLLSMGLDPASDIKGARFFASFCVGGVLAGLLAYVIGKVFWRYASPAERVRLHTGRYWMGMQDFIGLFSVPLFVVGMFTSGLDTKWWGWQFLAMVFALLSMALLADLPLQIAAHSPRSKRALRDDEKAMQRKCVPMLVAGFVAASVMGDLTWIHLGKTAAGAAVGFAVIAAMLAASAANFWRITRAWASTEQRRPINRPEWVSQLFAIGLFLIPMNWAKDAPFLEAERFEDIVGAPRLAVMLLLAAVAAGVMYWLGGWLKRLEENDVARAAAASR